MKKLSLLVIGSVLTMASLVAVLLEALSKKRLVDPNIRLVHQKLAHFTQQHPLEIDYIQDPVLNTGPAEWASDYLKKFLVKSYFIFWSQKIMSQITFGNEHLQPGAIVKVTAIYQKKTTDIYIWEDFKPQFIQKTLEKINYENPLILPYLDIYKRANPMVVKHKIDKALSLRNLIFTKEVLDAIIIKLTTLDYGKQPILIIPNHTLPLWVKYYYEFKEAPKLITIYIKMKKNN